jgi:integrase
MRKAGETRLFPTLKKGKSTFADATGKWYARLLKKVGLKDKSLVLHGLRHTFITRLSDAGVPEKIRMMLTGHVAQGVHGKVYDHRERVPMKLLQDGLERLQYPQVLQALNPMGESEETAA